MQNTQIKAFWLLFTAKLFFLTHLFAQTDSVESKNKVLYTLAYNEVPDNSKIPLLGFVNIANGNHSGLQLGFVNITHNNFKGLQLGFIDITKGNLNGSQIGFLNFGSKNVQGLQLGFGNHSKQNISGSQIGFFNQVRNNLIGLQMGFVNEVKDSTNGVQIGFVNETRKNTKGLQFGFINETKGKVTGWQVGFLNVADTIENGVPVGFFSFVMEGGYRAVEVSSNELYPINIAFKTGVPLLYSFVQGSFNSNYQNAFAMGAGLGSLIPLKGRFYFNPEATYHSSFRSDNPDATSLALNIRYSISPNFQIAFGPSIVQLSYQKNGYESPFFKFGRYEINDRNSLVFGARVALTYNFTELK